MMYDYLYVVAGVLVYAIGCVCGATALLLWKEELYRVWEWVCEMEDRAFYRMLDLVLGEHELINKGENDEN